jgi:hypothetical protein
MYSGFVGKSQKNPPLVVGMNGRAADFGAAAPERAKLAQASSIMKLRRFAGKLHF